MMLTEVFMALAGPAGDVDAANDVFVKYWSWARPAPRGTDAGLRDLTEWYLEPPEGLWMRHDENPNAVVVPLPPMAAGLLQGTTAPSAGASIMWVTAPISRGTEITRDLLPGTRSLQRAATLVAWLSNPRFVWVFPSHLPLLHPQGPPVRVIIPHLYSLIFCSYPQLLKPNLYRVCPMINVPPPQKEKGGNRERRRKEKCIYND